MHLNFCGLVSIVLAVLTPVICCALLSVSNSVFYFAGLSGRSCLNFVLQAMLQWISNVYSFIVMNIWWTLKVGEFLMNWDIIQHQATYFPSGFCNFFLPLCSQHTCQKPGCDLCIGNELSGFFYWLQCIIYCTMMKPYKWTRTGAFLIQENVMYSM